MPGAIWTESEKAEARSLKAGGSTYREIAAAVGKTPESVRMFLRRDDGESVPDIDITEPRITETIGDINRQVVTIQGPGISTIEAAIESAGIDLEVWNVTKGRVKPHTSFAKIERSDGKTKRSWIEHVQLYSVSLDIERRNPHTVEVLLKKLVEDVRKAAPRYPKLPARKSSKTPRMVEVGLYDHHLGKLCWEPETGSNYDLKIADNLYRDVLAELIADCHEDRIDQFVFPVGNDFLNADNKANTTTNGTPQDCDGRHIKVMEVACNLLTWAVELMAGIAPVHIPWVPGNHDYLSSWAVCQYLAGRFHHAKHVTFDLTPSVRKYYEYGINLLGMTHGNMPKKQIEQLPAIMAQEAPRDTWARTKFREWRIGHWHTPELKTISGVPIRTNSSLSGSDAWHSQMGYLGYRAAEVYIWDKQNGPKGYFQASLKG